MKIKHEIEKSRVEEINETKDWFSKKINKTDKLLAKLTKKIEDKLSISGMEKETLL